MRLESIDLAIEMNGAGRMDGDDGSINMYSVYIIVCIHDHCNNSTNNQEQKMH